MSSSVPDGVAPFGSPPRDVIPFDAELDLVIGRSDSAVVSVSGFPKRSRSASRAGARRAAADADVLAHRG